MFETRHTITPRAEKTRTKQGTSGCLSEASFASLRSFVCFFKGNRAFGKV